MDNEITIAVKAKDDTGSTFTRIQERARRLKAKVNVDVDVDQNRISSAMAGIVGSFGSLGSTAGSAIGSISSLGGVISGVLLAGLVSLAGALGIIPGLIMAMGAAAGSVIPLLAGLGAAGAVLKIGFSGIGGALAAYGKSAGGAGGASSGAAGQMKAAARQILAAEENLSEAKRRAVQASQNVTRAREQEIERLEDLRLAIRGAALEQEDAVLGLAHAQERMAEIQRKQAENDLTDRLALRGVQREKFDISPTDVKEAELAIRQAKLKLDEATESAGDLAEEQKKAARVGVDGSDQVTQALEQQRQANMAVTQAARQLKYAHEDAAQSIGSSGAGGAVDQFAEAMSKLSPNAQALVRALIKIKESFHGIKMAVQDRLLEGFAEGVTNLANRWLPTLGQLLPEIAGKLNNVGLKLMSALGDSQFIAQITVAVHGFGRVIDRLAPSVAGLVGVFGDLASAATPAMEKIGDLIGDALDSFTKWIDTANSNGTLEDWFKKGTVALENLWGTLKAVLGIFTDLYTAMFPSGSEGDEPLGGLRSAVEGLRTQLQKVWSWINTKLIPAIEDLIDWFHQNRDVIHLVIAGFKLFASVALSVFSQVVRGIGSVVRATRSIISGTHDALANVRSAWTGLRNFMVSLFNGSWIYNLGRNIVNWLARGIRSAGGAVMNAVRSVVPDALESLIPGFAHGGIRGAATGGPRGGLTMVGEHGRELVKLPAGAQVYGNEATEGMMGGGSGGGDIRVTVDFGGNTDSAFATAFMKIQQAGLITFRTQYVR